MTALPFTKMHGAGNDFVVVDATQRGFDLNRNQIRFLADRHLGIGCDQILVVERPSGPGADFRYRADIQTAGPVRTRTWTVRAGAWGLMLPLPASADGTTGAR